MTRDSNPYDPPAMDHGAVAPQPSFWRAALRGALWGAVVGTVFAMVANSVGILVAIDRNIPADELQRAVLDLLLGIPTGAFVFAMAGAAVAGVFSWLRR